MFDSSIPSSISSDSPQVVWLDSQPPAPTSAAAADESGREADPYEVIDFLLKKVEEQQARLSEQEGYIELQTQELETLKGQVAAARGELEAQLADYEVLMQNTLAVERELESHKAKANERPKISLPFYTEQKLAKLGYGAAPEEDRQAV